MSKYPKIITRGDITYVIYPEKVLVGMNMNQWISYNQYDNWNRQGINLFIKKLTHSRDYEYCTPIEQMTLAHDCGIVGTGTQKPKDLL